MPWEGTFAGVATREMKSPFFGCEMRCEMTEMKKVEWKRGEGGWKGKGKKGIGDWGRVVDREGAKREGKENRRKEIAMKKNEGEK